MDDHVAVVEEDPATLVKSFRPPRTPPHLARLFFHGVAQGADVYAVFSRHEEKVVGDEREPANVEEEYVLPFLARAAFPKLTATARASPSVAPRTVFESPLPGPTRRLRPPGTRNGRDRGVLRRTSPPPRPPPHSSSIDPV